MIIYADERELAVFATSAVDRGLFLSDLIEQLKTSVSGLTRTETKFCLIDKDLSFPGTPGFGLVTPGQAGPGAAE